MLKGEQLEQLIAQRNKLRCFIDLFLLTETDKFSVFLLSEMNNASSFALILTLNNMIGLKAVKGECST